MLPHRSTRPGPSSPGGSRFLRLLLSTLAALLVLAGVAFAATGGAGHHGTTRDAAYPPPAPPDTRIVTGPAQGSHSTATAAVFTYDSIPSGADGFQCRLDTGAFGDCTPARTKAYIGLKPGAHTFAVRARKGFAIDPTPAVRSWIVDAPVVQPTEPPPPANPPKKHHKKKHHKKHHKHKHHKKHGKHHKHKHHKKHGKHHKKHGKHHTKPKHH